MTEIGRLRSLLFAPAVRPDFIAKLPERGADAVVVDCEDATPAGAKDLARQHVRDHVPALAEKCKVTVRVNAVASEWFADDINDGVVPEVAAIVVPKIDSVDALNTVSAALEGNGLGHIGVIAGIETGLGVADARLLLAHERVVAAYFGAEDFIADMGGIRTASNEEVLYARSAVALAARLGGVPLLDQVVTDFRDDDRFIAECAQARAIGYSGKLCIHPGQVALANAAFIPSADEVDRARRLLEVYENATSEGLAAIDFEGQMVDEPLAVQARRIIATADK
ncbi:MAG: CoA ester lyase [Actinomycetota bacterium]|nr:CoA ester lyase [Actinomycetota bacterium]